MNPAEGLLLDSAVGAGATHRTGNFAALLRRVLLIAATLVPTCAWSAPGGQAELIISPAGAFTLNGVVVAEENLLSELRALREREPGVILTIETDFMLGPGEAKAHEAITAVGFRSVTWTGYKAEAERRRAERRRQELLFWAAIELVAVLVCAPFALSRKTAGMAFVAGLFGVWGAGVLIAGLVGTVEEYREWQAGHWGGGSGLNVLGLMIIAVPLSCVTGLFAGALFSARVGSKMAAAKAAAS